MRRLFAPGPMDDLLRARLRKPEGAEFQLALLKTFMRSIDFTSRNLFGQAFFALREAENLLEKIDGRTGRDLVDTILSMNGGTRVTAQGLEHVPSKGRVIIGSTHPIGTFDFIVHAAALFQHRPDLKVVANREAERFLGRDRIIAVDIDSNDKVLTARQTLVGMQSQLESDGALLVFGSGRVAGRQNGFLHEPLWRTGVTRMSQATNAPIVPASANMRNSEQYYKTRNFAKWISRGNDDFGRLVASLRYVSEFLLKLGGEYTVHYDAPVSPGTSPEVLQNLSEALVPGLYRP